MVPLAVMKEFAPTLWRVAHITPHAWGIEAYEEIIIREGNLFDILPQLGILLGFAVAVFVLGAWRLRVSLTRA
jgi:ABC-2 type transport system permease protein